MAFKGPKKRTKLKGTDEVKEPKGAPAPKEGKPRRERPGQVHPVRASASQEVVVEASARKRKRKHSRVDSAAAMVASAEKAAEQAADGEAVPKKKKKNRTQAFLDERKAAEAAAAAAQEKSEAEARVQEEAQAAKAAEDEPPESFIGVEFASLELTESTQRSRAETTKTLQRNHKDGPEEAVVIILPAGRAPLSW